MEEPLTTTDAAILSATKPPSSFLHRLISLDTTWSLHIHTIFQPVPRSLLEALEISGDGRFWFAIPVALFLSPLSSKSPHLSSLIVSIFLGFLIDLLLVGLLKFLIRRPRPVYNKGMHLIVAVDHWSFPSGHSSRVFFIASCLHIRSDLIGGAAKELGSFGGKFRDCEIARFLVLGVFVWSTMTSVSRVLLGRHFVLDVIAGACLGVGEALIVVYILDLFPIYSVE